MATVWKQVAVPPKFKELWDAANPDVPLRAYQEPSGLSALVSREPWGRTADDWRWHISVRYGDPQRNGRVPTWDELVSAAHDLRPGVPFVLGIPPKALWMSVHPDVLHLWETKDAALLAQWQENARAARELERRSRR